MKTRIAILSALSILVTSSAFAATIEMHVNGLVCAFCAQGIEKKLRKLPATGDVMVSLEAHIVAVALKAGQDIADAELRKTLTNAGYAVTTIQRTENSIEALRERVKQGKP